MSSRKWLPEEIYEKVSKVIVDELMVKKEVVTLESKFQEDFGVKLARFSLFLFEIENVFSIDFEFNELEKIFTVQDFITLVNEKID